MPHGAHAMCAHTAWLRAWAVMLNHYKFLLPVLVTATSIEQLRKPAHIKGTMWITHGRERAFLRDDT